MRFMRMGDHMVNLPEVCYIHFASGENAAALYHVQAAMRVLHVRTKEREARGVDDTLNQ
jgi:hypothetical protein